MKSSCTACGKFIEYEPSSAGLQIQCPHCGQATKLAAYATAPPPIQQSSVVVQPARRSNAWIVILVVVIGLVVAVPIMGLLAAIAIPNFVKARQASQRAACVANLQTIQAAKDTWVLEHRKLQTDEPTEADLVGATGYLRQMPACPAGGIYSFGPVNQKPACTIAGHEY